MKKTRFTGQYCNYNILINEYTHYTCLNDHQTITESIVKYFIKLIIFLQVNNSNKKIILKIIS